MATIETTRNLSHLVFGDDFRIKGVWYRRGDFMTQNSFIAFKLECRGGKAVQGNYLYRVVYNVGK